MSQAPPDPYASPDPYAPQPTQSVGYPPPMPTPYQPAAPAPAYPPAYPPAGYGHPSAGYGVVYPEPSQATLAFIFGILGIIVVQLLAPFAWWLGGKEKRAIDEGRRDPANRGLAVAGWVLGIIGTVLLGLYVLFAIGYGIFLVFIITSTAASSGDYGAGLPVAWL